MIVVSAYAVQGFVEHKFLTVYCVLVLNGNVEFRLVYRDHIASAYRLIVVARHLVINGVFSRVGKVDLRAVVFTVL